MHSSALGRADAAAMRGVVEQAREVVRHAHHQREQGRPDKGDEAHLQLLQALDRGQLCVQLAPVRVPAPRVQRQPDDISESHFP